MSWINCPQCQVRFGLAEATEAVLRQSSQDFYCPFGHKQHFPQGLTEAEKLRRERDALRQDKARLHDEIAHQQNRRRAAERSAAGYKGAATRIRNRVRNGVCPCCNRTFQNLAAHMANQHPGFQIEESSSDA